MMLENLVDSSQQTKVPPDVVQEGEPVFSIFDEPLAIK